MFKDALWPYGLEVQNTRQAVLYMEVSFSILIETEDDPKKDWNEENKKKLPNHYVVFFFFFKVPRMRKRELGKKISIPKKFGDIHKAITRKKIAQNKEMANKYFTDLPSFWREGDSLTL